MKSQVVIRGGVSALCALALGACGSIPEPPPRVAVDAVPTVGTLPADGAGAAPTSTRSVVRAGAPGWLRSRTAFIEFPSSVGRPPPPPLPQVEPRIEWWPRRPRLASALAILVRQPPGAPLERIDVRFAGRSVDLARSTDGWVGLAPLPLDSAAAFELDVAYRRLGRDERRTVVVPTLARTYPSSRIRISAGGASDPEVDARIAREREMIDRALRSSGSTWIPGSPFGWPRDAPIKTGDFGQRRMFNGNVASRHLGLDLRARTGNPIIAPAAGRVALTGSFFYQGNAVYLDHGLGLVTAYFHMSRVLVEQGEIVQPGQVLGRAGSTGRSTAAHLHWSAYLNGVNVDPETLVGLTLPLPGVPAAVGTGAGGGTDGVADGRTGDR